MRQPGARQRRVFRPGVVFAGCRPACHAACPGQQHVSVYCRWARQCGASGCPLRGRGRHCARPCARLGLCGSPCLPGWWRMAVAHGRRQPASYRALPRVRRGRLCGQDCAWPQGGRLQLAGRTHAGGLLAGASARAPLFALGGAAVRRHGRKLTRPSALRPQPPCGLRPRKMQSRALHHCGEESGIVCMCPGRQLFAPGYTRWAMCSSRSPGSMSTTGISIIV